MSATLGVPAEPFTEAGLARLRAGTGMRGLDKGGVERLLATIAAKEAEVIHWQGEAMAKADQVAARDATIAAKQEALRIGQQTIERLLAERDVRDEEIERLRVPGALETGRNGGWQEMIDVMREQKRRTNADNTALRARVAQLEAALRRIADSGVVSGSQLQREARDALRGAQ